MFEGRVGVGTIYYLVRLTTVITRSLLADELHSIKFYRLYMPVNTAECPESATPADHFLGLSWHITRSFAPTIHGIMLETFQATWHS